MHVLDVNLTAGFALLLLLALAALAGRQMQFVAAAIGAAVLVGALALRLLCSDGGRRRYDRRRRRPHFGRAPEVLSRTAARGLGVHARLVDRIGAKAFLLRELDSLGIVGFNTNSLRVFVMRKTCRFFLSGLFGVVNCRRLDDIRGHSRFARNGIL